MTCTIREWAPLTDLFNMLPTKVQIGLFTQDIKLTSIDVLPEFIALGTNFGMVYWYDRKKHDIQKLRCENASVPITALKIISTVDYMVACGNAEGNINIFQVPKSHHELLPENLRPKNKQVERYTVSELHSAPITSLEWSKNGMKLFSGDKCGHVVLTEIDFYMHLCKSVEILNESYEVVQLSYFHDSLMISTTYRSIICKKEDKWKISQVGKKDRKVSGSFGGIFYQNSLRPNDASLYCTRPGLRIWVADMQGSVQQTLLFKDLLNQRSTEVALINPISRNLKYLLPHREASFGILLPFKDNFLVTYSNDVLYILNPKELVVNMVVNHLRGILSVAVHKDELFILEGERSLIRLSDRPEPLYDITPTSTTNNFAPIATLIKGLTNKLQTSSIMSAIPTSLSNDLSVHSDTNSVTNAEEAREFILNTPTKTKQKMYDQISNQDFDNSILFKHKQHKKPDLVANASSCSSVSSDDNEACISLGTLMTVSTIGILPDLRSPESIKHDIEDKEKKLAALLRFDEIKMSCDVTQLRNAPIQNSSKSRQEHESQINVEDSRSDDDKCDFSEIHTNEKTVSPKTPVCMNIPNDWQLKNVQVAAKEGSTTISHTNDYNTKIDQIRRGRELSTSELSGDWEIV